MDPGELRQINLIDNSQSSSLNSSEEETENESDENSEVDNIQENGKTSSGFATNESKVSYYSVKEEQSRILLNIS